MNCIAIIQARMSSSRLPRKVMSNLSGEPMIRRIYDLVNKCDYVDKVIVATSLEKTDDELFEYCKSNKLNVYRGSLNNVLSRFVEIIKKYNPKLIVRITGDCPFIYPVFIDKQIKILLQTGADYIISKKEVNILCGQSVHSSSSLLFVAENSSCADDLEHVGSPFLTRNHRSTPYLHELSHLKHMHFQ